MIISVGSLRLVGLDGLEPSTSRLSGARSNHLSYKPFSSIPSASMQCLPMSLSGGGDDGILNLGFRKRKPLVKLSLYVMSSPHTSRFSIPRVLRTRAMENGGDDGIRTHDPLLAGQVLSQLSYTPIPWVKFQRSSCFRSLILVN